MRDFLNQKAISELSRSELYAQTPGYSSRRCVLHENYVSNRPDRSISLLQRSLVCESTYLESTGHSGVDQWAW